jgi:hypothetical protein
MPRRPTDPCMPLACGLAGASLRVLLDGYLMAVAVLAGAGHGIRCEQGGRVRATALDALACSAALEPRAWSRSPTQP